MMTETLRPARPSDLAQVEAVVTGAYTPFIARIGRKPGPMLDDYAGLIAAGHVHVIDRDGAVQAILVLIPEGDTLLLDNVAVRPGQQGRGLGRILMEFAERTALAMGCDSIRLYTNVLMTENIAIYIARGYHETHRAEEKGLHRVYMRKPLAQPSR